MLDVAERLSSHFPIFASQVDSLLPAGWSEQVTSCVVQYGVTNEFDGRSSTSRESTLTHAGRAEAVLVTGERIREDLPWLSACYDGFFLDIANSLGLGEYATSPDDRSAININGLTRGCRYEWHVDSNPLTALLFCTNHDEGEGGQLIFRCDPATDHTADWEIAITPRAGTLLLFDARRAAHCVSAITADRLRVSVPMNYYVAGESIGRPDDLDAYLYQRVAPKREASCAAGVRQIERR